MNELFFGVNFIKLLFVEQKLWIFLLRGPNPGQCRALSLKEQESLFKDSAQKHKN